MIADYLQANSFGIDVVHWKSNVVQAVGQYDFIVGLGPAFEEAARLRRADCKALYLGTGTHPEQTNSATLQRQEEFSQRYGVPIDLSLHAHDEGSIVADRLAIVGNDWVAETYSDRGATCESFLCVNSVTEGVESTIDRKDFSNARKHFFWMAGYGCLRRRLDVVVEVFSRRKDLHLYICGGVQREREFFTAISSLLATSSNIHVLDWVDVASDEFRRITTQCGYMIYPSCSDGLPGSVVNSAASGVVPIVTHDTGIDVKGFGLVSPGGTIEQLESVISSTSGINADQLRHLAHAAVESTRKLYTLDLSRKSFIRAFDGLL